MERRRFLKLAGSASASTVLFPVGSQANVQADAKVYEVYDAKLVNGTKAAETAVNKALVRDAVDALAKKMGNNSDLGKAWQALLPGITASSKICIKVNALIPKTSPQYCTLEAIILGLKSMFGGKFPAKNIFLIDNNLQGQFQAAHVDNAFGAANLNKLGIWHGTDKYGKSVNIGGKTGYVSTKWNEAALTAGTTCINFLCPRPHQYFAGYLSGHIKNMMGAVSTSKTTYAALRGKNLYFHNNSASKYYVDLMKHFKPQTALYISDMLLIPKHENAYYDKVGKRLAFASDPCAIDAWVVDRLKASGYSKPSKKVPLDLQTAKLGTTKYQKVTVPVPITPSIETSNARANREPGFSVISQSRTGVSLCIGNGNGAVKRVQILDAKGRIVAQLQASGSGIFHWNGKDAWGKRSGGNVFFAKAEGSSHAAGRFVLAN